MHNQVQFGFGFIMFLMVMAAGTVLYQTHNNNAIVTELVEVSNAKVRHVIDMRDAIRLRVNSVSIMLATDDPFERDEEIMRYYGYASHFVEARKKLEALPMSSEEKELLTQIRELIRVAQPYTTNIVELVRLHTPSNELNTVSRIAQEKREPLFDALNKLVKLQQDHAQEVLASSRLVNKKTEFITVVITGMVFLISFVIAIFVTRTVSRQRAELIEAYENVQLAMHSKSAFLANISHEIRTPITAMIGFAESTFFSNQTMEMRHKSIRNIIESGKHLLQIVNDVLDISKVEANKITIENIPADLFSIFDEAEALLKPLAMKKGLTCRVEYNFPLPREIVTDPVRLKQIIINLCSNAIKFTDEGFVRVDVGYNSVSGMLKIDVTDSGIGLSESQISEIFEPFKQADSSINRKYGGTGLGLTLSQQMAKAMHGNISVTSEINKGSCFSLSLDVGKLDNDKLTFKKVEETAAEQSPLESTIIENMTVSAKVLVAEDNCVNQELLKIFLEKLGVEFTIVDNGRLAVDAALSNDFDMIVMDIQMPEMDGIAATRMLRKQGYLKPIIALTANTSEEDRRSCFDAGCNSFLSKPINILTFFNTVSEYANEYNTESKVFTPVYSTLPLQTPEFQLIIQEFVSRNMPALLADISDARQHVNWVVLRSKLHELKGVAANMGYLELMDLARQMEFQALDRNINEINYLFNKIMEMANRITAGSEDMGAEAIRNRNTN